MYQGDAHVSAEVLEAYVMGKTLGESVADLKAHVMDCDWCCYRTVREIHYLGALTHALHEASSSSVNPIASRKASRTLAGCPN